jgi:hypothetical protein
MVQFLGPETERICQFLGPETDIMGERYYIELGSWSNIQIVVSDLSGEAVLLKNEEFPIKGGSTVMTCLVEERGNPEAIEFLWKK